MNPRRTRWILVGAVGVASAAALVWLFAPRPAPVELGRASFGPIDESVADQGYARVREAYVVAAPVSGRVQRIELHVGDRVTAGSTVIARIEPFAADPLDARTRSQAEAAVAAASAALRVGQAERDRLAAEARKADANLARIRPLAERGFAARQTLDNAEADARASRAAEAAAAAEVGARRAELARARAALMGSDAATGEAVVVQAPASGYVTRVLQESARPVSSGAPLVEIGDQTGLEAAIEFLSQDAVRMREGMPAEVYDWGGPGAIPAIVRRIEPQGFTKTSALGVEEQRVLVLLQFSGPPELRAKLGPGYRVWGRVFLRREDKALKIPLGALVRADGGWAVFRLVEGRARLTPVKVGALTDREAEITGGLKAGEAFVVFPSDRVKEGVRIEARR